MSVEHTKAIFNVRAFTAYFKIPYVKEVLYVRGRAACINSAALSLLNITPQSQSSIHQKKIIIKKKNSKGDATMGSRKKPVSNRFKLHVQSNIVAT